MFIKSLLKSISKIFKKKYKNKNGRRYSFSTFSNAMKNSNIKIEDYEWVGESKHPEE
jgi:hypothetical protein